jgi:hypothetical protein
MGDGFRTRVFCEAGEAIGNVARRLNPVSRRRRLDKDLLAKWRGRMPRPVLDLSDIGRPGFDGDVIDATYRVIEDEDKEA